MGQRSDAARGPVIIVLARGDLSALAHGTSPDVDPASTLAHGHEISRILRAANLVGAPSAEAATPASQESGTPGLGSVPATSAGPAWVLLPAEAKARGFKSALAFRRWCRRHEVPVRCDAGGRMQWVDRRDVDRAVEGLPARHGGGVHAEAGRLVADFIARQRR